LHFLHTKSLSDFVVFRHAVACEPSETSSGDAAQLRICAGILQNANLFFLTLP
jgi:hypothetical protein